MFDWRLLTSPGVVGAVQGAQADFSFNLALTGQREKVVDFGLPYAGDISNKNISQTR